MEQSLPIRLAGFEAGIQTPSLLWRSIALIERICSGVALALILPLFVPAALVTVALSGRSPFIAHRRLGYHNRPIWVIKLRTMWNPNARSCGRITMVERLAPECSDPAEIKNRKDPRVTSRFAELCRRYSIDELPQLWHVVTGEMALIGPRPLTAAEIEAHYGSAADQLLSVKPGLSGLWQIKGRSRLSYVQRRRLDLFMIRNWSFELYLTILIRTIPTVLAGKDAW